MKQHERLGPRYPPFRDNLKKGTLKRGGSMQKVRSNPVCGTAVPLTRVLQNLLGAQKGVRLNLFWGPIEPSEGFDRALLGRSPIFRVPF